VLICVFLASLTEAQYTFSVIATTYDFEAKNPIEAIGHFDFSNPKSDLIIDIPNYSDYVNLIMSDTLSTPWTYVAFAAEEDELLVTVYFINNKTMIGPNYVQANIAEAHCADNLCYGLDLDNGRVVEINPFTGFVSTLINYNPNVYIGCMMFGSAMDREGKIYYTTLVTTNGDNAMVAFDLNKKTFKEITGPFAVNNTGPYCYDSRFGLLSLGATMGGVVAYNPMSAEITVLRDTDLGGIPGEMTLDCSDGIVVLSVVDWRANGSPMLLLGFDFTKGSNAFHNSTVIDIHGLWLADRNVRSVVYL